MDPSQSAIIVGVCQVAFTALSGLVIDRLGRRILLLSSGFIMAVCSIILGVYFYLKVSYFETVAKFTQSCDAWVIRDAFDSANPLPPNEKSRKR